VSTAGWTADGDDPGHGHARRMYDQRELTVDQIAKVLAVGAQLGVPGAVAARCTPDLAEEPVDEGPAELTSALRPDPPDGGDADSLMSGPPAALTLSPPSLPWSPRSSTARRIAARAHAGHDDAARPPHRCPPAPPRPRPSRCCWRSSTMRWCTRCSMLVRASAASRWVVGSSTAAALLPSLSARRDSERASRSSAVIAFADGGSGRALSGMAWILRRCSTTAQLMTSRRDFERPV